MTADLLPLDISSREFKANPYPHYARLRAESPIHPIQMYRSRAWIITRYDDVMAVLKDDARFVKNWRAAATPEQLKNAPWTPPMFKPLMQHLLTADGLDHARLRGLVHKAFTPRMIERMQTRVETLAQELITRGQERGRLDLIADYALPIPLTVISEMMGIDQRDQPKFHRWVKYVLEKMGRANPLLYVPQALLIARLLRGEIRKRRTKPTDDLITALVQAEEEGDRLSEDELLSMIFIMLVAGFETTVNLIGSGALALIEHPDQLEMLRRDPALIKPAVEELLRFTSPVELATERYAMQDITMHGVTIPKGELVMAAIGSANRDERQFEKPDTLDLTRANNKHIAFGLGVHYCVGAPLARLEGAIAINTLVQCLPDLRLAVPPDALRWRPGYQVRGLESLPVVV